MSSKAKLKHKCQCGKPDMMSSGLWQEWEYDNVLHFKSADRYCERCGAALCEDCSIKEEAVFPGYPSGEVRFSIGDYCRTCAELLEER